MKKNSHAELVAIGKRWVIKNTTCTVAFSEIRCAGTAEIPDVIGFGSWGYSIVVECKTSRSDFLRDQEKICRKDTLGMGRYRFFLCPENLIKMNELPNGWGLIYVNGRGHAKGVFNPYTRQISKMRGSRDGHPGFNQNLYAEHCFMYSVLRRNRDILNL